MCRQLFFCGRLTFTTIQTSLWDLGWNIKQTQTHIISLSLGLSLALSFSQKTKMLQISCSLSQMSLCCKPQRAKATKTIDVKRARTYCNNLLDEPCAFCKRWELPQQIVSESAHLITPPAPTRRPEGHIQLLKTDWEYYKTSWNKTIFVKAQPYLELIHSCVCWVLGTGCVWVWKVWCASVQRA